MLYMDICNATKLLKYCNVFSSPGKRQCDDFEDMTVSDDQIAIAYQLSGKLQNHTDNRI